MAPQMSSDTSQERHGKWQSAWRNPRRLCDGNAAIRIQCPPKEGHEAVEAKEQGSRALNSLIRPLTLGFDAQMSSHSSKVVSRHQRFIKSLMICSAVWVGSVEKSALGDACLMDHEEVTTGWVKGQSHSDTITPFPCRPPPFAHLGHTSPR
jgi:hypothetical protein